jgi:hypothetical protein
MNRVKWCFHGKAAWNAVPVRSSVIKGRLRGTIPPADMEFYTVQDETRGKTLKYYQYFDKRVTSFEHSLPHHQMLRPDGRKEKSGLQHDS